MSNIFTKEGYDFLQRRAREQRELLREIGRQVGEAAGPNCDWHDNFEFEDARRRLEMESGRMRKFSEDLTNPRIIAPDEQNETVAIGVTVELSFGGNKREYTIGAFGEVAVAENLLTYKSPIVQPLLGLQVGDVKTVTINGRAAEVEVIAIHPPSYRYHALLASVLGA